jgi:hypothetical protein
MNVQLKHMPPTVYFNPSRIPCWIPSQQGWTGDPFRYDLWRHLASRGSPRNFPKRLRFGLQNMKLTCTLATSYSSGMMVCNFGREFYRALNSKTVEKIICLPAHFDNTPTSQTWGRIFDELYCLLNNSRGMKPVFDERAKQRKDVRSYQFCQEDPRRVRDVAGSRYICFN